MKTYLFLLIISISIFCSYGQEKIKVIVEEKEMSQGIETAFTVIVPESDIKNMESDWKKYANNRSIIENVTKGAAGRLVGNTYKSIANAVSQEKEVEKNRNKLRVERENNELVVRNIVHKHVTQDMLDIYARITQLSNSTQVSTFFRFSDSIFINETNVDEETLLSIKNYIYEFGITAYQNVVKDQIKVTEKELRRMNVVLNNLVSKNESLNKDVTRAEADINKCESDINLNNKQLDRVIESLNEVKKDMLDQKKKSIQYESLKELSKERQKEKRKLMNQNKRLKTKIKKLEGKIKNTLADIIENEMDQKDQESIIAGQENEVIKLEDKYLKIQ
ncbi:MAG: hypothetical protein HQ541_20010 [Mariniphaga sp.]|nr:hypothetical protein [Mariniphaga sp.]